MSAKHFIILLGCADVALGTLSPVVAPTIIPNGTLAPIVAPTAIPEVHFKNYLQAYFPPAKVWLGYIVIVIASARISRFAPKLGLPRMTGYILAGIVAGPYVLNLVPTQHIRKLRIIDETSLGFIALAAGSKFNYFEMKPVLRNIVAISTTLVAIEYATGFTVFAVLVPVLGRFGGAGFTVIAHLTWRHIVAMAMLAGSLTVARSPSSVMAIVDELKASGAFTRLTIGVTIFLDLAVIWLYDISESAAQTLTDDGTTSETSPLAIIVIAFSRLIGATLASVTLGIALGFALPHILFFNVHEERLAGCLRRIEKAPLHTPIGRILHALAKVYIACDYHGDVATQFARQKRIARQWLWVVEWMPQLVLPAVRVTTCLGVALFPFMISHLPVLTHFIKPLLVLLFAALVTCNYSPHMYRFRHLLHGMANNVYCFYFTLTGAALELDMLGHAAIAASVLALFRILSIVIGVFVGSKLATAVAKCEAGAGAEVDSTEKSVGGTSVAWMAYITQAGVALGLAKKVQLEYAWGSFFNTVIVAVVIFNQLVGPPLLRLALRIMKQIPEGSLAGSGTHSSVGSVLLVTDHVRSLRSQKKDSSGAGTGAGLVGAIRSAFQQLGSNVIWLPLPSVEENGEGSAFQQAAAQRSDNSLSESGSDEEEEDGRIVFTTVAVGGGGGGGGGREGGGGDTDVEASGESGDDDDAETNSIDSVHSLDLGDGDDDLIDDKLPPSATLTVPRGMSLSNALVDRVDWDQSGPRTPAADPAAASASAAAGDDSHAAEMHVRKRRCIRLKRCWAKLECCWKPKKWGGEDDEAATGVVHSIIELIQMSSPPIGALVCLVEDPEMRWRICAAAARCHAESAHPERLVIACWAEEKEKEEGIDDDAYAAADADDDGYGNFEDERSNGSGDTAKGDDATVITVDLQPEYNANTAASASSAAAVSSAGGADRRRRNRRRSSPRVRVQKDFDLRRLAAETGTEGSVVVVAISRETSSAKLLALLLSDVGGMLAKFANAFSSADVPTHTRAAAGGGVSSPNNAAAASSAEGGEEDGDGTPAAGSAPIPRERSRSSIWAQQLFRRRRSTQHVQLSEHEEESESPRRSAGSVEMQATTTSGVSKRNMTEHDL